MFCSWSVSSQSTPGGHQLRLPDFSQLETREWIALYVPPLKEDMTGDVLDIDSVGFTLNGVLVHCGS